jgi:flagellar FliL protein
LLLVIVLVGGGLGWVFHAADKKPGITPGNVKSIIHLEPFVLNLQDPNQKAYLRIGIDVGVDGAPSTSEPSSAACVALLRDTIIQVLAGRGPDEMLSSDGKEKLKKNLVQALQKRMPRLGVQEIYFTDFLVQR